jgi:protein SCO1/2
MMKPKRQSRITGTLLLLTATLLICSACAPSSHDWRGTAYDPPQPARDFSVKNETGQSFTLSEQRGSITLLYFGYTYCPDVCPATVAIMAQVFNQLDAPSDDIRFVMISVDPERESPEAVEAYMRRFHPDFIGLWVDRHQLDVIKEDYGIVAIQEPSENPDTYLITHTARVFLIDQDGNLRAHYPFGTIPEDFIADLTYLLERSQ